MRFRKLFWQKFQQRDQRTDRPTASLIESRVRDLKLVTILMKLVIFFTFSVRFLGKLHEICYFLLFKRTLSYKNITKTVNSVINLWTWSIYLHSLARYKSCLKKKPSLSLSGLVGGNWQMSADFGGSHGRRLVLPDEREYRDIGIHGQDAESVECRNRTLHSHAVRTHLHRQMHAYPRVHRRVREQGCHFEDMGHRFRCVIFMRGCVIQCVFVECIGEAVYSCARLSLICAHPRVRLRFWHKFTSTTVHTVAVLRARGKRERGQPWREQGRGFTAA